MARRATYINQVAALDSASILKVDCGDLISGEDNLAPVKGKYLFMAYEAMGWDCINLGEADLDQGQAFIRKMMDTYHVPVISANVYNGVTGERFLEPYIIKRVAGKKFMGFEWGGLRVGVFGVLQLIDENTILPATEGEDRLIIRDPVISAREMVEELKGECDLIVCLAHTGWVQAKQIARGAAGIDMIIVGHGANIKPKPYLVGETPIVMPGDQGKQLGVVTLTLDDQGDVVLREGRSQPMDETVADDPEIMPMLEAYREELNEAGKAYVPASSDLEDIRFVGSKACGECHNDEFNQWRKTRHARAVSTLTRKSQDHNPECVKCHVTGYGIANGFHSYETTPDMQNVGCEVCHGSGIDHINFINGESMAGAHHPPDHSYTLEPAEERCVACHNNDHDDNFVYDVKVKMIDHSMRSSQ